MTTILPRARRSRIVVPALLAFAGVVVALTAQPLAAQPLAAQPRAAQPRAARDASLPRRIPLTRRFDLADGLDRTPVFAVQRAPDGRLWVATGTGVASWDGTRFVRMPFPSPYAGTTVRRLLFTGARTWAASQRGLFVRDGAGPWRRLPDLREGRQWQLASWARAGEAPTVVVALEDSLVLVDERTGRRRGALAPVGFPSALAMLATTESAAGRTLWVAALGGGVWRWRARDAAPTWVMRPTRAGSLYEDVRPCPQLGPEGVVVAAHDGAYAIGDDGVPRRLGTLRGVLRVACTGTRAHPEYWIGTTSGAIERLDAAGATPVTLEPAFPATSVQALDAIDIGDDEPAIFVSQSRGGLWRGRARAMTMLDLPGDLDQRTFTAIAEQPMRDGRTRLVASGDPGGARDLRHPDDARVATPRRFVNFLRLRDSSLVGIAADGLVRLGADGWRPLAAVEGRRVRTATRVARAGGEELLASLPTELLRIAPDGTALGSFAPWLGGAVDRLAFDSVRAKLWAARHDTIFRVRDGGTRADTLTRRDGLPEAPYRFLRHARLDDGRAVVLVGSLQGLAVADADAPRPAFVRWDTTNVAGLHDETIVTSALFPDGRLVLGTAAGIAVLRLARPVTAAPRVLAWYDEEDGLADPLAYNTMRTPGRTTLFVATARGIGQVDVPEDAPRPIGRVPLVVHVTGGRDDRTLADSAVLAWDDRVVHVDARLVTLRHEEGTRYAFALRAEGAPPAEVEWTRANVRTFEALSDGRYRLVVHARDWLGREVPPHVVHLVVRPPWWRAPWAVAGTLALLVGGAAAGARARTRRLKARARDAEAAAARLRASEERFRRLFDRGADPQLLVEGGTVVDANPAAIALLGRAREALVGVAVDALVAHPADAEGDPIVHDAAGASIPVALRRTAIPLDGGTVEHLELRDLREPRRLARERAELHEQLLATRRLESLGTLAGGVAHDFNNLLGIIRMNAELADTALDDADAPTVRDALGAVRDASDRGRDLVRRILTFGRRTPPVRRPLRLADVVRATHALVRATLPPGATLALRDEAGDDGWIDGDATQLQQLVMNLATNAAHALRGRDGGALRIAVERCAIGPDAPPPVRALAPGPAVRLVVEDTGAGMSPETLARIFEPFFTTKPMGEGTGLGLAVLHGIVGAHGGAVHVTSAPGRGTRVEIVFPRVAPAADAAPAPSAVPATLRAAAPDGELVLVVDDEVALRDGAARALAAAGFTVRVAPGGTEALALLDALDGTVACLVTDQTMPGMSGDALAHVVAQRWPEVPVVITSGNVARVPADALRREGVVQLLEKPYTRAELVSAVTRALGAARRARAIA